MRTYDDWKTTDDTYEEECQHPRHFNPEHCDCKCCNEPEPEAEPAETIEEMAESVEGAIANGWEGFAYMWTCDLVRAAKREVAK
jgi:hypothetical protein